MTPGSETRRRALVTGVWVTAVAVLPAVGGAGGSFAALGFLAPALGGVGAAAAVLVDRAMDERLRRTLAFLAVLGGIVGGLAGAVLLLSVVGFLPEAIDLPGEERMGIAAAAVGGAGGIVIFVRAALAFATDTFRWKRALVFGLVGAVVGGSLWVGSVLVDVAQREAAGLDTTNQALAALGAYIPAILVGTLAAVAAGADHGTAPGDGTQEGA